MKQHNRSMLSLSAITIAISLALTGCGENTRVVAEVPPKQDHDHDHDHDHDLSGRIVFTTAADDHAYIFDLATESIIKDVHLSAANAALYASPDYRYAVAVQRNAGVVNFIDSGYETEAHGDHFHFNEHDPELLSFELFGELPTHYNYYAHRGVVFFDGRVGTPASVYAISDHSLSEGRALASHGFTRNQHGAAEIRGNHLFVSYRSDQAEGVLPEYVEVYNRHHDHFDFVQRFTETCPNLHGSAITETYVAFGCGDGVLVISEAEEGYEAHKIANVESIVDAGSRIGTLYASDNTGVFVGRAGQQFYWVDVASVAHDHDHDHAHSLDEEHHSAMTQIQWRGEANAEATIVRAGFNYSGNRFAILDNTGMLTIVRFRADRYEIQSQFEVLANMGEQLPHMAFSPVNHSAYISDPLAQEILVVDLHDGEITERFSLDVAPASLVWLGFTQEDDGHHHH